MNVRNCARCGGDHDGLEPFTFQHPFAPPEAAPMVWSQWVMCPVAAAPILIAQVDETAPVGTFDEALDAAFEVFIAKRAAAPVDAFDEGEREAFKIVARELVSKWKGQGPAVDAVALSAARKKLLFLSSEIENLPSGQAKSDLVHTYLKLNSFLADAVGGDAWKAASPVPTTGPWHHGKEI